MLTFSKILFVAAAFVLSGCASTHQFVALPDQTKSIDNHEKARIYVMRPESIGCAVSMEVKDNEQVIGKTGGHGFLCWERQPGKVTISGSAENTSTVDLEVAKGLSYYIWQEVKMGILMARNKLQILDEPKGKEMLGKCKPPEVELSSK